LPAMNCGMGIYLVTISYVHPRVEVTIFHKNWRLFY